nr:Fe3+/spermidine/putrescine ABC transporter ATP-binding protein [Deltaproteobacteria bacterium]
QQQRVALARVLVRRPRLLLLDEPFSALDAPLREGIRPELRRILKQFNVPVLLVTHDHNEVIALGDNVTVVDEGRIRQCGPVHDVFNRPEDMSVARIVGMETVVPGRVVNSQDGLATVAIGDRELVAVSPSGVGAEVEVCIRAADVILQKGESTSASPRNRLNVRVQSSVPDGALVRVHLDAGFPLTALVTRPACEELGIQPGAPLTVLIKAPAIHLIPRG